MGRFRVTTGQKWAIGICLALLAVSLLTPAWAMFIQSLTVGNGGAVVKNGTLSVKNSSGTTKFNVTAAGAVSAGSTLSAAGASTLTGAVACGSTLTTTGAISGASTITAAGAATFPVINAGTTITAATATATSAHYGKVTLITTAGAVEVTLPANGATVGTWMDFLILIDGSATATFTAATADSLVGANDLDLDAVTFATGHRVGALVRFISTGSVWVALNLGQTTMGTTD